VVWVTQIVSMLAVLWAGFVLGRATSNGFAFDEGFYGNGQRAAVVLAVVVIIVARRQLLKSRCRAER
jgi:hypothetical protein